MYKYIVLYTLITSESQKKDTKRSGVLLLCLVSFFATQTLCNFIYFSDKNKIEKQNPQARCVFLGNNYDLTMSWNVKFVSFTYLRFHELQSCA